MSDQPTLTIELQGNPTRFQVVAVGRILLFVALMALWETGYRSLGDLYLAGPLQVAQRIVELLASGAIWKDVLSTAYVTSVGFLLGWSAGVVAPLLLRTSPRATQAVEPFILGSMGVPKFALMPLLIVWFGIGAAPKISVVALMTFYVIFITTFAGLRSLDRRLIDMARIVGASRRVIITEIIGKSLLPFLFVGMKVALPRALSAAIVGEFLVSESGLGHMIEHSRQMADTVGVFAGIVLVVLLVFALNALLEAVHSRLMRWQPKGAHAF